ncbi:MAG: amidase [Chloroflexi bacterium]|nr:MAG: amidase [Chloroflexota bacterium]
MACQLGRWIVVGEDDVADELVYQTARDLAARIRSRDISAREVMAAHLARIDAVNPLVNAIVTQIEPEEALKLADAADAAVARGDELGLLHGLPIAHKDLEDTAGMRTTYGSPVFRNHVPAQDTLMIQRIKAAGALSIGKTNVPEWGAGSHTFNPVFGPSFNAYDRSKTCGGSSGGAGLALACGMIPIADGSDLGGSLRNPGNFNNVVGFRVSEGRVPAWPAAMAWHGMGVKGPMGRTVGDVALLLAAIAGPDPRAPLSISEPAEQFLQPLERDFSGVKVAWSPTLGGLPVDPRVTAVLESQRHVFSDLGCEVVEAEPDFSGADEVFNILRAWSFAAGQAELLRNHRDQIKDTVIWNIEQGLALSGQDVARAHIMRTQIYERVRMFMEEYEYLLCPVNQVPPFDVTINYPTEINGVQMENYIAWMKSASRITVTGHPAISVPCGFTPEGLPVGIQIVGRHRADFAVLQLAHAFEQATQVWRRHPTFQLSDQ